LEISASDRKHIRRKSAESNLGIANPSARAWPSQKAPDNDHKFCSCGAVVGQSALERDVYTCKHILEIEILHMAERVIRKIVKGLPVHGVSAVGRDGFALDFNLECALSHDVVVSSPIFEVGELHVPTPLREGKGGTQFLRQGACVSVWLQRSECPSLENLLAG